MGRILSIAFDDSAAGCVLRLEGEIDITCSAELKRMLIEAIASGKEVQVDLAPASDLDVTAVQLLWAASREAEKAGASFAVSGGVPENIGRAVCEAGFENFPAAMSPKIAQPSSAAAPAETADDRQV
jgi:anti-anti-sigma regulatory factor